MLPEPLRVIFHSVVESGFVISLTASAHKIFAVLGLPQMVRAIGFGLGVMVYGLEVLGYVLGVMDYGLYGYAAVLSRGE